MVVLSAVICTKAGKAIVARQFVEMTRIRIEGLLAAFPKLMSTDAKQQHTFIETEAVRYVYQPLDTLYLLLITNRASNIVEDLDTLRLLSKVVPSITGTTANLTEDKVADKCFDLIFAFDEVITTGGYRENINLQQIRTNMEMDSHEEKLHNMIKSSKMESARDQAAAAAKAIKDKQREQQRMGISGNSTSFAGSNLSSYDSPSISAPPPSSTPSVPSPISQPSRSQPVKGMSLGTGGKNKALEEALMKEDKLAPIVSNISKAPSTDHHSHAAAAPLVQHPLMLAVTEKVSAKISKDGLTELLEVKGQLMLTAASDDVSNCSIKLKPINNPAFAFNTHPKINKQVYEKSSILQLKEAGKGFPSGRAVGILKWTSNGVNEDLIPIRINCWPEEESRGQVNVSMEYSMDLKNFELHDVRIIIPLGTSASPNVVNADGNYKHNSSSNELVWELDLIDSSNSSGSLEFNIQQKNVEAFFPIHVHFSSKQQYCPIDVLQITSMTGEDHIPYGITKGLSSEEKIDVCDSSVMRELQTMTFPLLVLCLFCFVLRLNNAALLCGGRGYKNEFGICVCGSNYHGVNCEFYYCPFGPSWFGLPVKSEARNISVAPCSDMGFCNIHTGECECRPGYEGRACERISCATSTFQYPYERIITTITIDGNSTKTVPLSATSALMCSGHGVCKTLREAAAEFNGLTSVNPSMSYNNWDADRIQGCLCDYGWEGYDCSLKSCPAGRDPTDPFLKYSKEETFFLQCQANEGYFAIMVLGKFTDPIPYDADPAYLQHALEAIPNVGKVSVSTPANTGSFPQICGSSSVTTTTIQFMSRFGSLPPILVTRNVTTSRVWPQASPLSLGGASPVLRFKTTYTMSCPACSSCDGSVYLAYKTSLSQAVDVTAANGTGLITLAVLSLEDLYRTNWPDLQFRVAYSGASNRVCNGGSSTSISIELFSSIGNIDGLTFVDASTANITLSSNKGSGNVYECSNQGICDHSTGICSCTKLQLDGNYMYRALSSDGRQSLGSRGDCGYLDPPLTSCVISNEDACNGKGLCLNDTMTCSCYQDWYGLTCNLKTCPKGPALFDEPILPNSAHRLAECSGNGHCNRQSGFCDCRPGFSGKACQIRDCPQDSAGIVCSGHGSCASIAEIYGFFGYSYGSVDDAYVGNGRNTWDALLWNECLCFAAAHLTERRWPTYYPVGPSISISGTYGSSEPIAGWEGWDCSRRRCRVGQDTRTGYTSVLEVQRVACLESKTAAFYFQLKIFDELSDPIYAYYGAHEIKQVIEAMASIGNVTVWFPYFSVDGINTACNETLNSTLGGFYVRFDTEFGNIPQMQPSGPLQKQVTVHEVQAGVNTLAECSGTSLGVCINGVCSCNRQQFSSNGVDAEGSSGDCSFLFPYARSDDRFLRFSST